MEIDKFSGESSWDAVVNRNSMDIVEEDDFRAYCLLNSLSVRSSLRDLEVAYKDWNLGNRVVGYHREDSDAY